MHIAAFINPSAGTVKNMNISAFKAEVEKILRRNNHSISWFETPSKKSGSLEGLASCKCDYYLAAGGDGTINSILPILTKRKQSSPLIILPLGTANLLATDLGYPADWRQVLGSMDKWKKRTLTIGQVNNLLFFHSVLVGAGPVITRIRESQRMRGDSIFGWISWLWWAMQALIRRKRDYYIMPSNSAPSAIKTSFIALLNGDYEEQVGPVIKRNLNKTDKISAYAFTAHNIMSLAYFSLSFLGGKSKGAEQVKDWRSERFSVSHKKKTTAAVVDGELCRLKTPLICEAKKYKFQVIAP